MEDLQSSTGGSRPIDDGPVIELSGKIMLAAVIALFCVIVFVLVLHLYARWFWRRRDDSAAQSHRPRRRFVFVPGDPVASMHRGLDASVIRSLPVLIFNPDEFKDGLECAVCLCDLTEGEKARLLPKCNHGFHVECIDMWFQSHHTCPLCRNSVAPDSIDSSDSGEHGYSSETPNFPTNVLFWGNETQVSTRETGVGEVPRSPISTPTAASFTPNSNSPDGSLVIEIPRLLSDNSSPSTAEEESKSPATTRLRSLRRLLSRDKRVVHFACSPRTPDVEGGEVVRGQSSKPSSDL